MQVVNDSIDFSPQGSPKRRALAAETVEYFKVVKSLYTPLISAAANTSSGTDPLPSEHPVNAEEYWESGSKQWIGGKLASGYYILRNEESCSASVQQSNIIKIPSLSTRHYADGGVVVFFPQFYYVWRISHHLLQLYWIWLQHCLPPNSQKCFVNSNISPTPPLAQRRGDNEWIFIFRGNCPFKQKPLLI